MSTRTFQPRQDEPSLRHRTRQAFAELEFRPSRRHGQSFLIDAQVARRISAAAEVQGKRVLEIGPGLGALTEALIVAGPDSLIGIEIDRDLTSRLQALFTSSPKIHFVCGDALEVDFSETLGATGTWRVVANLPYSVGVPILLRLLEEPKRFERLVVMLQREVADRIVAEPGGKEYGPLSLAVSLRASARRAFRVAPGAFCPRPKVESTVVVIEPYATPRLIPRDEAVFRKIVRAAFGKRRKTLRRALTGVVDSTVFDACGIDSSRRGETLSLEEFGRLADAVATLLEPHDP